MHNAGTRVAAADAVVDSVDQSSMQSFPASDPPGWIHVRIGGDRSAREGLAGTRIEDQRNPGCLEPSGYVNGEPAGTGLKRTQARSVVVQRWVPGNGSYADGGCTCDGASRYGDPGASRL
jgi:hypothetical protein